MPLSLYSTSVNLWNERKRARMHRESKSTESGTDNDGDVTMVDTSDGSVERKTASSSEEQESVHGSGDDTQIDDEDMPSSNPYDGAGDRLLDSHGDEKERQQQSECGENQRRVGQSCGSIFMVKGTGCTVDAGDQEHHGAHQTIQNGRYQESGHHGILPDVPKGPHIKRNHLAPPPITVAGQSTDLRKVHDRVVVMDIASIHGDTLSHNAQSVDGSK